MRPKAAPLALLAALVVVGAVALAPRTPRLGSEVSGDARLAADARAALEGQQGMHALAVARVERGQVTTAGLGRGVDTRTRFELGSVTKPLTGMLLSELAGAEKYASASRSAGWSVAGWRARLSRQHR